MSDKYFQFYLIESGIDKTQNLQVMQARLKEEILKHPELQVKRISMDLVSHEKSISILCEVQEHHNIKKQLVELLSTQGLSLKDHIDEEWLHHQKVCEKHKHQDHHDHDHDHDSHNHWTKAGIGLVFGLGMLGLSLSGLAIPASIYFLLTGVSALLTFYIGQSVYQSAWRGIRENRLNMSSLYTVSTLTILAVSLVSIFFPGLPMMFESAPLVLGFWHLGEGIEHSLLDQISSQLDVRDCLPKEVRLVGESSQNFSPQELIPNDLIEIEPGVVMPIDGVLLDDARVYTTRIDGSPYLKTLQAGSKIKQGMVLDDEAQKTRIQVIKSYENSYLSLIAKNIKQANHEKAPIEAFANQVLKYFVPALVGVAAVSGLVIGSLYSLPLAIQTVVSVLVSACPCALSLITPMAVKIGMKKSADFGVHFKNGKTLQASADVKAVVFDYNGTLTTGVVSVKNITIDNEAYLSHIAALESFSNHPFAKVIRAYILNKWPSNGRKLHVEDMDTSNHSGIKGTIEGETFIIGNRDMLLSNGISEANIPDNGLIYVAKGDQVIAEIELEDPLREDAKDTILQLKKMGITSYICTGADLITAKKAAKRLGIPESNILANAVGVASEGSQNSKENFIKNLQREYQQQNKDYKVAMVGDAANDATAIKTADVGFAVESEIGDGLTEKLADVTLQKGRLFPIVSSLDVSRKTKSNIYQNLFISLTYNSLVTVAAAGLFIGVGLTLSPAAGVAMMILESTIVFGNLFYLKQQNAVTPTSKTPFDESELDSTVKVINTLSPKQESRVRAANEADMQEHQRSESSYQSRAKPFFEKGGQQVESTDERHVECSQIYHESSSKCL